MLHVTDLLSLPQFETFRLISGPDGLQNEVTGTSILEWETPKEIAVDFAPGDFVMTTLYMYRNELDRADEGLKALIKRRVAAIAIKTTFTDTCSREVIELADRYRIPIFIYRDVYLEDLIFTIQSAVFADNSNEIALEYLKYLMETGEEKTEAAARKLNPLFRNHLICFCLVPATDDEAALDNALASYRKTFAAGASGFSLYKSTDALIRCRQCLLYIHTSADAIVESRALFDDIRQRFDVDLSRFRIGSSHAKGSLAQIKEAVNEAVTAAVSASLAKETHRTFSETGADAFLLPAMERGHFSAFYEGVSTVLTEYDERHNAGLMNTLLCYTESEGDMALTAKKLFQHYNTIRYRLEKIRTLLGITSASDAHIQFYVFSKMHEMRKLFGNEPLI